MTQHINASGDQLEVLTECRETLSSYEAESVLFDLCKRYSENHGEDIDPDDVEAVEGDVTHLYIDAGYGTYSSTAPRDDASTAADLAADYLERRGHDVEGVYEMEYHDGELEITYKSHV